MIEKKKNFNNSKIFTLFFIIHIVLLLNYSNCVIDSIRIFTDYTTLNTQQFRYGTDFIDKIRSGIDKAVTAMRTLIIVPQLHENLIIKFCNPSIQTEVTVMTSGIPADLIIFPYIIDQTSTEYQGVDFYGVHCSLDEFTNRPVAGIIGINQSIDLTKTNWAEYLQQSVD